MTQTESKPLVVDFIPGFDEDRFSGMDTSSEPAVLQAKREEGFNDYRALPSPTNRTEEWRRTDPALFPFAEMERLPQVKSVPEMPEGEWDRHLDVVVSVDHGSMAIADRSGVLADGRIHVMSLADAAERHPELVRDHLQGRALPSKTGKFEALNDAFWNAGLCVHIPEGVELPKGVLIRCSIEADRSVFIPRLLVVAGKRSRATIAEHLVSPDAISMMAVMEKELYVGEAANLQMITLQEWGLNSCQIANDWALVERDARINWFMLNFGSRLGKMRFGSDVAGPGAAADLDGIFCLNGEQHMDQKTLQIHSSADTYSRLLYKGAVRDRAYSVYQGLIIARRDAVRVDAYQTNNNLVLNKGARADSIPGLEIDADDLKCSHGSTHGNIDPEQLYYLRARGISEAEARKILILGFYDEVVERIPLDFIREHVRRKIDRKLEG